jgi:hypothetical protein
VDECDTRPQHDDDVIHWSFQLLEPFADLAEQADDLVLVEAPAVDSLPQFADLAAQAVLPPLPKFIGAHDVTSWSPM